MHYFKAKQNFNPHINYQKYRIQLFYQYYLNFYPNICIFQFMNIEKEEYFH